MKDNQILDGQRKMIAFCGDQDNQRIVLAITHHARRWRLYAGFLGGATSPICSGETKRFSFTFEGSQFKVYLKSFFGTWEKTKPEPPYPGEVEKDSAFETMLYATQVSERSGNTHVVYVDWRFEVSLPIFLDELKQLISQIRTEAMAAAVKAKERGQVFNLFEDEEEEQDNMPDGDAQGPGPA